MKWWLVIPVVLLLIASLVGCTSGPSLGGAKVEAQGPGQAGTTLPPVQTSDEGVVIAEGVVEPERSSYLSFELPGEVVEVRAEAGDQVEADDVLLVIGREERVSAPSKTSSRRRLHWNNCAMAPAKR